MKLTLNEEIWIIEVEGSRNSIYVNSQLNSFRDIREILQSSLFIECAIPKQHCFRIPNYDFI